MQNTQLYEHVYKHAHRNPFPNSRPSFREILATMLEEEETVLTIPKKDAFTHKQASMLGAVLTAGEKMYKVLQNTYIADKPSPIASWDRTTSKEVDKKLTAQHPVVPLRHNKPPIPKKPTNSKTHGSVTKRDTARQEDPKDNEIYDDTITVNPHSSTENLLIGQNSSHSAETNGVLTQGQPKSNLYDDIIYDVIENTHATSSNTDMNPEQYYQLPVAGQQSEDHTDNLYEAI